MEEIILDKNLFLDIKTRVRQGQLRASFSANADFAIWTPAVAELCHGEFWQPSVAKLKGKRLVSQLQNWYIKSSLPSIEELEAKLSRKLEDEA